MRFINRVFWPAKYALRKVSRFAFLWFKRLSYRSSLLALAVFVLGMVFVSGSDFKVEAATVYITRDTQIELTAVSKAKARVVVTRQVDFRGPSWLELSASDNVEVFTICPAFSSFKNLQLIRSTLKAKVNRIGANPTVDLVSKCLVVKVPYVFSLKAGRSAKFSLEFYTTDYVFYTGGMVEVVFPGFKKGTKFNDKIKSGSVTVVRSLHHTLEVKVPKKYGSVALSSPKSPYVIKDGYYVFTYDLNKNVGRSLRLVFGKQRVFKFDLSLKVNATSTNTPEFLRQYVNNEVQVFLPNSSVRYGQRVLYDKIEPTPWEITHDKDGNTIGIFKIPASSSLTIHLSGFGFLVPKEFSVNKLKKIKLSQLKAPDQIYFASTQFWQSDHPEIRKIASRLKRDNLYDTLIADIDFVIDTLQYDDSISIDMLRRKGAVRALQEKTGVCMEYSDLLIAILRAQGIPARAVFGNTVGLLTSPKFKEAGHQWVEVWIGSGWLQVDPTWSRKGSELIGPDLDHFMYYVGSSPQQIQSVVCKTFDIGSVDSMCKEYRFHIDDSEVSIPDQLRQLEDIVPLSRKVEGSFVKKTLYKIGSSRYSRVVFSLPGLYVLMFTLVVFIFNLASLLWRSLVSRSQDT